MSVLILQNHYVLERGINVELLFKNMVVEWISSDESTQSKFERILWISHDKSYLYLIDLDEEDFPILRQYEEVVTAIENNDAKIVKVLTAPETINYDQLPKESLAKVEERNKKAWEIVQQLVNDEPDIYDPSLRGIMVRDVSERYNVSIPTVHKYLKRYWKSGKQKKGVYMRYYNSGGRGNERIAVVGSVKRGRPRKITELHPEKIGVNVDVEIHKIFMISYTLFIIRDKLPVNTAYKRMIRKFFVKEYVEENGKCEPVVPDIAEIPLYETFKYWVRKEQAKNPEEAAKLLYNERRYNLKFRPKTGSNTKTSLYPGSIFQIDATVADVYLRSRYRPDLIIGKPVMYIVVDVFSHMIVGLYIGLEGPSYIGAMMAIQNTGSSKVDYCRRFGIEISEKDWPCMYLPEQFTADRGELLSKNNVNLTDGLNIDIEYAAPYRADWKPIVESCFNLCNKRVIHTRTPGAVSLKMNERGMRDNRLDAVLTIDDFTKIMIGLALLHNKSNYLKRYPLTEEMIADGIKPIPLELWNWGIRKGGALQFEDEESLKRKLLPRDTARITDRGIMFNRVPYTCQSAIREGWFVQTNHSNKGRILDISYDPRNTSKIYIRHLSGFEECNLIDPKHHTVDKSWDEYFHICEVLDLERLDEHQQQELIDEVSYDALIEETIEAARLRDQATDASIKKQLDGIRENGRREKELNRQRESFVTYNQSQETIREDNSTQPVMNDQSQKNTSPKSGSHGQLNRRMEALRKAQEIRSYTGEG